MKFDAEGGVTSEAGAESRLEAGTGRVRLAMVEGLERLHELETARLAGQRRELQRLEQKLGGDDSRLTALQTKIELSVRGLGQLAREAERGRALLVAAEPGQWIVHGHVRDAEQRALSGLTVELHDAQGDAVAGATAATTEAGYFKIERDVARSDIAEHGHGDVRVHWFLRVKAGDRVVHGDPEPLAPEPGGVDYRELTAPSPVKTG